jgi:hypothetical protein
MSTVTLDPQSPTEAEKQFNWPLCYEAENLLLERIGAFLAQNSFARILSERMREETGTLFLDWVDHLVVSAADEGAFRESGFTEDPLGENSAGLKALWHPEAMLPRVLLAPKDLKHPSAIAIRPEFVAEFAAIHGITNEIEGEPFSRFRKMLAFEENDAAFYAIERRGYRGYISQPVDLKKFLAAREIWQTRRRRWDRDVKGYAYSLERLQDVVDLGPDLACHLVFEEERAFWQKRNRAGIEQKRRQDSLGLGWANHDHHTFRSSREHFLNLMKAWEMLGFHRRERYYAGSQAGWGAQIVEQPIEGITIFNDVDLYPDETEIDFSREPLSREEKKLGTVGLWVGLHGESFLDAGMHHLECRFDYERLREQLAAAHIKTMAPFSDFPFLKQAFTQGERWAVRPERITRLRTRGLLTDEQAEKFAHEGAIGSHLENLQRKGGFKGFNQKSVSVIIELTDPRKQDAVHKYA